MILPTWKNPVRRSLVQAQIWIHCNAGNCNEHSALHLFQHFCKQSVQLAYQEMLFIKCSDAVKDWNTANEIEACTCNADM